MTHTAPKFKGHPQLAGPGCWDVVQLMDPTMDPGFQHQKPDPCGSPLLLSAGERGDVHHKDIPHFDFHIKNNTVLSQHFSFTASAWKRTGPPIFCMFPSTSIGNDYLRLIGIFFWLPFAEFCLCLLPVCCVPSLSNLSKQRAKRRTTTSDRSAQSLYGHEPSDDRGKLC